MRILNITCKYKHILYIHILHVFINIYTYLHTYIYIYNYHTWVPKLAGDFFPLSGDFFSWPVLLSVPYIYPATSVPWRMLFAAFWSQFPTMLHAICSILELELFILYVICSIWELEPPMSFWSWLFLFSMLCVAFGRRNLPFILLFAAFGRRNLSLRAICRIGELEPSILLCFLLLRLLLLCLLLCCLLL